MHFLAHVILSFGASFALGDKVTIDPAKKSQREEDNASPPIDASVLRLNRYTFRGNVLNHNAYVERWVVLYCLPWFPPCQAMQGAYNHLASTEQKARNIDILSSRVRFAQVDCSTDRVLCNDMKVGRMPSVVIYQKQRKVANWVWKGGIIQKDPKEYRFLETLTFWLGTALSKRMTNKQANRFFKDLWLKCWDYFENMWLGRIWYGMGEDIRLLICTLCISAMIWVSTRLLLRGGPQDSSKSCDDPVPELTQVPLSMVLLDGGAQRASHKKANPFDSVMLSSELRSRTRGEMLHHLEHTSRQKQQEPATTSTSQINGYLIL